MSIASDILNEAFARDPAAMHSLCHNRVPCNSALADDPYVQVGKIVTLPGDVYFVGAIGLVNAMLAAYHLPLIATQFSEPNEMGIRMVVGFQEHAPSDKGSDPT